MTLFKYGLPVALCLLIAACGGGGGDSVAQNAPVSDETYTLSGQIFPENNSSVDSDVQFGAQSTNDLSSQAQTISNPTTLGGYLSETSGTYSSGEYFLRDASDFFQFNAIAGQSLTLDLYLADTALPAMSGSISVFRVDTPNVLIEQVDFTEPGTHQLELTSSDDYLIQVSTSGSSTPFLYRLSVNPVGFTAGDFSIGDMIENEMIVQYAPFDRGRQSFASQSSPVQLPVKVKLSNTDDRLQTTIVGERKSRNRYAYKNHVHTRTRIHQKRSESGILYAEPNLIRYAQSVTPNDPGFYLQWNQLLINTPAAWEATDGEEVIIAVIDSGISSNHDDLLPNLVDGYDFVSLSSSPGDGDGPDPNPEDLSSDTHGSHVAGIAAAVGQNGIGIAGVAYNAKIMPLRVLGVDGSGNDFDLSQAIRFAAGLPNVSGTLPARRADVINLSLGGEGSSITLENAIQAALAEGVIIIAAAGNNSSSTPFYPAAYDGVISVSSVSENKTLSSFSNFGATIDVTAPGGSGAGDLNNDGYYDGILSTVGNNLYAEYMGTSMAAPHVAGVAALMKAVDPALDATSFRMSLEAGQITEPLGSPNAFGFGLIDASKAVTQAGQILSASLATFPAQFLFSSEISQQSLSLSNPGSGSVEVVSVSTSEPWLNITGQSLDGNQLGNYLVEVSRTGLPLGTSYSAEIQINYRIDGGALLQDILPVSLQVPSLTQVKTVGNVFAVLVPVEEYDSTEGVTASDEARLINASFLNGVYSFTINDVPPGEYFLFASTENDGDRVYNDDGEAQGAFPAFGDPERIVVSRDSIDGLDFEISYRTANSASLVGPTAKKSYDSSNLRQELVPVE